MKKKKFIAVILALAMAVAYMPDLGMSAAAAAPDKGAAQAEESIDLQDEGDAAGQEDLTEDGEAKAPEGNKEASEGSEAEKDKNASEKSSEASSAVQEEDEDADDQSEEQDEDVSDAEDDTDADQNKADNAADADYAQKQNNEAVDVQGPAANSRSIALQTLGEETSLDEGKIDKVVKRIFAAPKAAPEDETPVPSHGDGTTIESMTAKWITVDTTDNDDPALLYVKPSGTSSQSVRLQINYALSGEIKYEPGDVTITIPAHIFSNRNGGDYGNLIIPYPEDPSKKNDYNWKQVGDKIVLTNTKRMSAATKGYIQFEIDGLSPQQLVDMAVSDPFTATIEVTTHKGNLIAKESNPLTAQFDTEANLTNTGKSYSNVSRVKASQIPESQRVPGEETYIKVNWYVWGDTSANTLYTIDQVDSIPQASAVETRRVVADDTEKVNEKTQMRLSDALEIDPDAHVGGTVVLKTEADIKGFVIKDDGTSETTSISKDNVYRGYASGRGSYYYYSTAYPASQFETDVNYTFHNTIKYTVTEVDPEVTENLNPNVHTDGKDPQKVTTGTKTASVTWSYSDPKWVNPGGHYMVHKNGNDDTVEGNRTHKGTYTYRDLRLGGDGYYGIYPSAINELQDENKKHGEDGSIRLSYTVNTIGYTLPWMYDGGLAEFREGELPARMIGNYNRPVTMTTTDTGVSLGRNGEKLTVLKDYTYAEIEFPSDPYVCTGKPQNINADGSWIALDAGDGTFRYTRDSRKANWPDITLQLKRNGQWEDYAVASWKSGSRVITLAGGGTITDSGVVPVPEDTENFRTVVTTQNTAGGEDATEALQAAIDYDVRAVINLKGTEEIMDLFDELFAKSHVPQVAVYNSINMLAERADVAADSEDREIVSIDRDGYDSIRGYTTDTSVYPSKSATQNLREVDYENRTILIHYSAKVEERSVINEKKTWEQAVEEGRLVSEKRGIWRDLLPKGVTPDPDTIKLRSKDKLIDAYTIEDYQGSGRTLLVAEVELTPVPQTYRSGDMTYYEDVPTISFDAIYDFESLKDYGYSLHNVISFESGNDTLGTIENYKGEPDDPYANNNISTKNAFKDNKEKDLMKDLNEDRDDPVFVYAGVTTNINILNAARTSLYKDVQVNNDGIWSDGTYYRDIYGPEADKEATDGGRMRTVYEGGQYSYRLRIMSDPDTVSTGLIMYDTLENFYAQGDPEHPEESDNDIIDVVTDPDNDFHWHGKFCGVDVSQLEEIGCAPVIYYSTKENLVLADPEDPDVANRENTNLSNSEVWVKASDYTGDLKDVKAVAIDCRKARADAPAANKDSKGFFRLQPLQSAVALIRMQAPSGEEAREIIANKGVWGDSGMAYNNAHLICTSLDEDEAQYTDYDEEIDYQFVHKDYTKVGLKENSFKATKKWNDDNDRDGIRPEKITFRLLADGEDTGITRTLNVAEGETEVVFEHIPYTTPDGTKIHYTVAEDEIEGYTSSHTLKEAVYEFTNTHVPERTSVSGSKTWDDDSDKNRPASIDVVLYANGKKVKTQTVKPAPDGTWEYEFTDLFKYENGKEIEYTVEETKTPGTGDKLDSYVSTVDGFDIANTYHPYGELDVTKTVSDTTEVSAENEFTFNFAFSRMQENDEGAEEEVPVFDEFDYQILDAEGEPVTDDEGKPLTGKVTSNSQVKIKGGQRIHITEIPEYIKYKVTEEEKDGFTQTSATGTEGTVTPNETAEAAFTNKYSASGQINLQAKKILENRQLIKNQFLFELYEVTEDEEGNEVEEIKSTASSDVPDETVTRDDGTVESSSAVATFGALRFTQKDHGKTFRYRMKELDRAKDGYTYSTDIYEAEVTVTDNGDGTLTITPVYKNASGKEVQTADFINTYEASGDTTLQAWKDLPGRDLKDGEFTFELLDEKGDPITNEDGEPVTVTNKSDGTASFTPEVADVLNYDEKDIGKTYYYGIREVRGEDDTVIYDESIFGYAVKITDNGDGTVYGEQTLVSPVFDKDDPDKITGWTEEDTQLPVFTNELKDGGFSIAKTTVDSEDADPNQEFTFKVRLIGNGMEDLTDIDYKTVSAARDGDESSSPAGAPKEKADPDDEGTEADTSASDSASSPKQAAPALKAPGNAGPAKAPGDMASGTYDNVDWRITSDGELIIGNGGEQTFANNPLRSGNSYGWNPYRDQITSVRFDGTVRGQNNMEGMFMNCVNCSSIDLKGFDTSLVTGMYNMFLNCRSITSLDVSEMDTSACTIFRTMFNGMSALEELKGIGSFNTSNATTTRYMFSGCSSLKSLDLHKWDTSKVTTMQYMFNGMSALEELNISGFDTSKVTNMASLFGNTAISGSDPALMSSLKKLDISSFDTSKVTNMANMFAGLTSLEQIKIGSDFTFKNSAVINDPAEDEDYTGKWIHIDGNGNAYTASELAGNPDDLAGTWVWERANSYVVYFSAKGAKGSMDPVMLHPERDEALPALAYTKPGERFSHWAVTDKDGKELGQAYEDGATIPAGTYSKDDRVYLKAVFEPIEKNTEMAEGEFEITLKAGEKAVFENIPAGTAYQVYEQTEDGWILVEQKGVSGTVEPLITSEASFVNKYEPGTTSAQFYGTKTLDYRAAKADAFEFVLREGNTTIERVKTMDGGFIQFSPIIYKEADIGTHTYTIQEVDPQDSTLDWDAHTETVQVEVTADEDGNLKAAVTYDRDGVKFSNMTRPGTLRLSKTAEGLTPENENDEFTFRITLNNADGMPLGSDESIFWYTVDSDRSGSPSGAPANAVKFTAPQLSPANEANERAESTAAAPQPKAAAKKALKAPAAAPAKAPGSESSGETIFHATEDMLKGTAYAVYNSGSHTLTFFRSYNTYTSGSSGPFTDIKGNTYTGTIYTGVENTNYGYSSNRAPWRNILNNVYTVTIAPDQAIRPKSTANWFNGWFPSSPTIMISSVDFSRLDMSQCTNMDSMFRYCDRLVPANIKGLNTWDTSRVTNIAYLFQDLKFTELDLSNWDTSSMTNIHSWLSNNNVLKVLNLSGWDLSKLTTASNHSMQYSSSMEVMFLGPKFTFRGAGSRILFYPPTPNDGSKWVRVEGGYEPMTAAQLAQNWNPDMAGTWVRERYNAAYTVKYDANGGIGDPAPVTATTSQPLTLPSADDVGIYNDGMICIGWSQVKEAVLPEHKVGDKFVGMPGGTTTLYAVWMSEDSYLVHFNGNGGYSPTQYKRVNSMSDTVTLPTPTHPGNREFLGWNTKEDGSGTMFTGSATGEQLGGQPGETLELYAQWLDTEKYAKYKVEHYKQNPDSSYSLFETDNLYGTRGSKVSPEEKEYEGYLIKDHAAEYTLPAAGQPDLTVKYYYDRLAYEVAYDGNGATSGQMLETQSMLGSVQYDLLENQYHRKGYIFTGWNTEADGSGQQFVDRQRVKNLTKVNGETVTLYAQWLGNEDGELTPTNGEIIVKCKAGETIVIPDLPAGTTYNIEEISNPAGWSQKGEIEGNGGTITANMTDKASVTNTYKANGSAQLKAHKVLEGADIEEGQFKFELLDENNEVIDTKYNGEKDTYPQIDGEDGNVADNPYYQTSLVEFDPLDYTQDDIGKTYTYTIREAADDSKPVDYDPFEAEVSVHIEDAGNSILDVQVTYTNTGGLEPIFENAMKKSELKISKAIAGATEEVEDEEFTFTVDLKDKDGLALEGSFDAEKGDETLKVSSGDTITLKGGEEILIKGLPHGTTYEVTEEEKDNWEQTKAEGASGMLEPGETSEASFENTYHEPEKVPYNATGQVQFTANKKVEGGTILEDDEFTFELTDESGEPIQTKTCDKVSTDDEAVTESTITFDKITYDLEDLEYDEGKIEEQIQAQMDEYEAQYDAAKEEYDAAHADDPDAESYPDFNTWIRQTTGHSLSQMMKIWEDTARENAPREGTFTYFVREVAGDDPDVEYDTSRYYYKVHAVDKGDGTIETDVKMYKPGEDEDTEVDDITFVNSKTTQIKVYKRWVDNGDQDEYRPTKEEFAEKIHLMATAGGVTEEVKDAEPTIREDADGNLTIIYEGLEAYKDGEKITYTVKEDEIEHYTAKDGQDEVEDGGTLMNVHAPDKVSLELTKKMPERIDIQEAGENATVVFSLSGKDKNGKVIYENHVGMTFDESSGTYETVKLDNIPANITLTIEEVYGGNYEPKEGKIIVKRADLEEDEDGNMKWVVEFENTPTGDDFSSGIVNNYGNTDDGIRYEGKE